MPTCVIRWVRSPAEFALNPREGPWLAAFDPDNHDGIGLARWTSVIEEALRFDNPLKAHEFWMQVSSVRPKRHDGKPNRPLTAYTVAIEAETLAADEKKPGAGQ